MLKVNLKLSLLQTQSIYNLKFFRCLEVGHIASQYPNKRVMILKYHKQIQSENDRFDNDEPPLKDCSDVEIACPIEEETLILQ